MANKEERILLLKLFAAISADVKANADQTKKHALSMIAPASIVDVIEWILENQINNLEKTEDELISLVVDLFSSIHAETNVSVKLCQAWIGGKTYYEMSHDNDLNVYEIEQICSYNLSYQFSFLIGNIIDCLEESPNTEKLNLLQKKMKYGVKSTTAISICEKIFNDRVIAEDMAVILNDKHVSNDEITGVVKCFKEHVLNYLEDYPSFFGDKIKHLR